MNERYDVVLVGACIVGASIASVLAPHRSILLLVSKGSAGYHATGRSAALYAPSYGPDMIRSLTRASAVFFHAPQPGFAEGALLRPRGALFAAR